MAATTETFTPEELWAGEVSEERRKITVKTGENLAANTIVMLDADGLVVAHDGVVTPTVAQDGTAPYAVTLTPGNLVAGVLIYAVDATSADTAGAIYLDGNFIGDKLVWPATIDGAAVTNDLKQKLLLGSEIRATFYNTGELV